MVERETGPKLKTLRSDRGGEFTSHAFNKYYEELGIRMEFLAPYIPQQNGVVERKNWTIVEMARCLLKDGGLPTEFWAEAMATLVYIINRSPTHALEGKTLYEMWHGEKLDVHYFRIFRSIVFVLTPSQKLSKLE